MKRPDSIWFEPLDVKKGEDSGLWYRLPEWVVRAYRLKSINLCAKVMIKISDKALSFNQSNKRFNQKLVSKYFKENWLKKIDKEKRKARKVVK